MFCPMCGKKLEDGSSRCSRCGHLLTPEWMPVFPEPEDQVVCPEPEKQHQLPEPEEQALSPEPEAQADSPEPAERDLFSEFLPETGNGDFSPEAEDRDLLSEMEEQDIFAGLETKACSSGPELPAEQPPRKTPLRKGLLKKLLTAGAVTLAAAVFVCGAVFALTRKPFTVQTGAYHLLPGEDGIRFLTAGREILKVEGEAVKRLSSLDGGIQVVLTREGACHLLRDGQVTPVAERVYCMALSGDGSALACVSESLVLSLYDTQTLEERRIDKSVYGVSVSPDGKSLAYYTMDEDGTAVAWFWGGKESTKLAENRIPFALSNGGKFIYCRSDNTGDLYVLNSRGGSLPLATDMDPERGAQLNADHTEILFAAEGGIWLSRSGKEAVRLGEGALELLLPQGCVPSRRMESGFDLCTWPAARLGGHYYTDGSGLFWMSGKGTLHPLAVSAAQTRVSADGKRVFWVDENRNLWTVERGALNLPRLLAGDVAAFVLEETGGLWFTDTNRTLWYREDRGMARLVSEDADAPVLSHDGRCLFFTGRLGGTGSLWESRSGAALRQLLRAERAEVFTGITLITGEDGGLYILTENGCEKLDKE